MPNVMHAINTVGHDIDYEPSQRPTPTACRPGTRGKLLILRDRIEAGEELWHDDDLTSDEEDNDPRWTPVPDEEFLRIPTARGQYG